jgi:hypothetical protein
MEAAEKIRIAKEIDDLLALSRERLRQSDFLGAQRAARKAIQLKDQLARGHVAVTVTCTDTVRN